MKQIIAFLFLFSAISLFAQSPALINYQAVVRDASGNLITSGTISLGISIHDAITGGNQLYFETHNGITPNAFGVVNVLIGGGTVISGNFLMINWGNGNKYLQVYVNSNPIGSRTQMVSVPYALYANTADTANYATTALNASSATMANNINLPGSIMAYGGTTPPAGWLLCDGTSYSVNQYPNLYAVIGANFGGQPGVFNVPDFRGRFLRMVDGNAGNDPDHDASTNSGADGKRYPLSAGGNMGNNVGSLQNDEYRSHSHRPPNQSNGGGINGWVMSAVSNSGPTSGSYSTSLSGGSETRPQNVYVNYIIKY
jgi:microcystin-dependent protein